MMQKTQAVHALQEGCSRLGLPNSTAAALLQFLSVKRVHDQFVPDKDRQLRMSPGAKLDKLWHYMLLNTTVSSSVHALLGGVVDHRGTDAWDLADDTKLLQRLYALNVLRLEGHEPDVEQWTEPHTVLHTLCLTTSRVASLQSLPGGGRLYVTPSLTQQQQGQLGRALHALYAQDTQPPQPSTPEALPAASAASVAAAVAAAGRGIEPAAKRPRVEQQQQQEQQRNLRSDAAILNIIIKDQLCTEVHFKVKHHTNFGKVFQAYCSHKSIERTGFRFMYNGMTIGNPISTPKDWGMKNGDVIHCFVIQVGC